MSKLRDGRVSDRKRTKLILNQKRTTTKPNLFSITPNLSYHKHQQNLTLNHTTPLALRNREFVWEKMAMALALRRLSSTVDKSIRPRLNGGSLYYMVYFRFFLSGFSLVFLKIGLFSLFSIGLIHGLVFSATKQRKLSYPPFFCFFYSSLLYQMKLYMRKRKTVFR